MLGNILWEIPETGRECSLKPGNTLVSSEYNIEGMLDVTFRYQGDRPDTLYLVQAVSAVEFKEIGQRALEQGLLPEASAEQVRAILSELQDTDNDVLMLARLKK